MPTQPVAALREPAERLVPGVRGEQLDLSLRRLQLGPGDPTHRRRNGWWRATRNDCGAVLIHLESLPDGVRARAWGPGAATAIQGVPDLLGQCDPGEIELGHAGLSELARRHPWLRIGRTNAVFEALAPIILGQRVTGNEAISGWRRLVEGFGEPAPGPSGPGMPAAGMRLPPEPSAWASIPSWTYLAAGVELARRRPLIHAATRAAALERTLASPRPDAALRSVPGVGEWTAANVRQLAFGDPDAWSVGDYHVPDLISTYFTGRRGADAAELLAPFTGQRYRVELLIGLSGVRTERRGPRRSLPTHLPLWPR